MGKTESGTPAYVLMRTSQKPKGTPGEPVYALRGSASARAEMYNNKEEEHPAVVVLGGVVVVLVVVGGRMCVLNQVLKRVCSERAEDRAEGGRESP
jgi:hypothetical protein